MSESRKISRRQFLTISAGTLAATTVAACSRPTTPAPAATEAPASTAPLAPTAASAATAAPAATKPPTAVGVPAATSAPVTTGKYKEAPMLAELVKAGKLPPVEQRLPPNPLVVKPKNAVGKYGGTLTGTCMAPEVTSDIQQGHPVGFFRFSDDLKEVSPEIIESFKLADDLKSCTFKLRQGIKWSDGQPYSADDVMFYVEDIRFNKDIVPSLSAEWQPGKQPMKVTKVDDFTVKFEFTVPNPAFHILNFSGPPVEPQMPKHWLSKYHAKYNPNADAEAKALGFNGWAARITKILAQWNYGAMEPDTPVLGPWRPVAADSQRQQYERNPYYWKVDTEGNQLPYIDKQVIEYAANLDVANLKAISGACTISALDLQLVNYPVLKQGEQAGAYTVKMLYWERGSDVAVAFNTCHTDPVLKTLFNDVRFRQAMSAAINRQEINELVFLGQGTPAAATVNQSATFFKQEWADNFAKFDQATANKLLDAVGLNKKGADGIRLRPDGKPMQIQCEYLPQEGPKQQTIELCVKHWAAVGVKVDAQGRERAFLQTRLNASQQDMSGWHVDRQLERAAYAYGSTQKLGPGGNSMITYAYPWINWFNTGGKSGQEPPQEAKDLFDAYAAWQQTVMGTPEYKVAATKVYDMIAANLWVIGIVRATPTPAVIKNNLENVFATTETGKIWFGAANWDWLPHSMEQWFFKS